MLKKTIFIIALFHFVAVLYSNQDTAVSNLVICNPNLPRLDVTEPLYDFKPLLPEKAWWEWNEKRPSSLEIINSQLPYNFALPFAPISQINFIPLLVQIPANGSIVDANSESIHHNILRDDTPNYGVKLTNEHNFILIFDGITKPNRDFQSYATIYINRKNIGMTDKGLITQRKIFRTNLKINRHLLRVKIVIQDEIRKQWRVLLNTQQPRDKYFPVKEGYITIVKMTYNPENEYNTFTFTGKFVPINKTEG